MNILVVDRDPKLRSELEQALSQFGDCDLVDHGEHGIKAVKRKLKSGRNYQVICVECHLMDRSGFEVLDKLRYLESMARIPPSKRTRVLVTTALNDPRLAVETYKRDCQALVLKPCDTVRIVSEVKRLSVLSVSGA